MTATEAEFLSQYDPTAYWSPLVTVDAVIFTFFEGDLWVLLTLRNEHPAKGQWALPGGFLDETKDHHLEDTVQRKLFEKTGVHAPYVEQLLTVGSSERDPRGWSVTVAYTALVAYQDCQTYVANVSEVKWFRFQEAMALTLAFDHDEILQLARERMKQKALYSMVPVYALPSEFTLPELQHFIEVLIDKPIQKKSFRRRIEQADVLTEVGLKAPSGKGRPSMAYRLKADIKDFTFIRNLEL